MVRYGLLCLLMAAVFWGWSASAQEAEPRQSSAGTKAAPAPGNGAKDSQAVAAVPPDAPVITIQGLCDHPPSGESAAPDCKTVITRAGFEKIMELIHPNSPLSARKFFAAQYAKSLITAGRAQEMGLDKKPEFDVRMEVPRMTLGRKALKEKFDAEEWAKVTDKEMQNYYRDHTIEFVGLDVDRIFVPKMPRDQDSDAKLSEPEQQKRRQEWFEELRQEAEKLRVRALAGEDFLKLQSEAGIFAGLQEKDADPSMITLLGVRRSMFSEGQRPVMDVKIGELSPVLTDQNGYSIFRVKARNTIPFEKVKTEIHRTLRAERAKHDMDVVLHSVTATYDDGYFGPETPKEGKTPASEATPAQSQP
jgi:hypothetical protein